MTSQSRVAASPPQAVAKPPASDRVDAVRDTTADTGDLMATTEVMTDAPDLTGFLMAHRGFRAEFGRLATAARQVRDAEHAALIDEQIELVLHLLHHHHTTEDTEIWPYLLSLAPAARPALDRLEAQHEDMDPLFTAVGDRSRPVAERADDLERLHEMLNDHLDEEEREAVPLILTHYGKAKWDADGEKVQAAIDQRKLPVIFGWLGSASTEAQRAEALRTVPAVPRLLFRLLWWPAYRKRFTRLYGDLPMGPNPTRVLS
jgi:hypothetical protein